MIRVKPFKGVRPAKEYAKKVASFPYDVINSQEAKEIAKGNDYSFLHVVKPEIDLPEGTNIYDDKVYQKGRENYDRLKEQKVLIKDEEPSFYIYREKMGNVEQKGLVVCCHIDDYLENRIKKHEHTRTVKEEDRIKHVQTIDANTGPVFLTYRRNNEIQHIIEDFMKNNAPEYDFKSDDGIEHTFYKISDQSIIEKIIGLFNSIDSLYVADGHHRSAAAAKTGERRREANENHTGNEEYNWFLTIIFPHDELYIMDYNRVVKDLNGNSEDQFIEKVKQDFYLEPKDSKYSPEDQKSFGMYLGGKWYKLTAIEDRYDKEDVIESLDVAILQKNLLTPILDIGDPKTDERIDFIGGIRGLEELERLVDSGKFKVAFAMHATAIEQLMDVADMDKVMPPKSTWFEPKLRSGMISHDLS